VIDAAMRAGCTKDIELGALAERDPLLLPCLRTVWVERPEGITRERAKYSYAIGFDLDQRKTAAPKHNVVLAVASNDDRDERECTMVRFA
jgi:hypothetical protein